MPMAQPSQSVVDNARPYTPVDTIDFREAPEGMSDAVCETLAAFFDRIIATEVISVRLTTENDTITRCQFQHLNGVEEYREQYTELHDALAALRNLDKALNTEIAATTLHIQTKQQDLDVNYVHIPSPQGDQYLLRVRVVEPVPASLETLELSNTEMRHLRNAFKESTGLISIGASHRHHLEDWQRAISQELTAPDRAVLSLAPRLLEPLPRITQTVLPAGERWDQRLWQLASQAAADVILLVDDGTHGYAPDQLGVLADRCLVIQLLQVPDISKLADRTPTSANVHRMVMHLPLRRLCKDCREPHPNPSRNKYTFLDRTLPTLSDGVNAWLSASQSDTFQQASGCETCSDTGYRGELCVTDSVSNRTALEDGAALDLQALSTDRAERLMELAKNGDVCLDEVRRVL